MDSKIDVYEETIEGLTLGEEAPVKTYTDYRKAAEAQMSADDRERYHGGKMTPAEIKWFEEAVSRRASSARQADEHAAQSAARAERIEARQRAIRQDAEERLAREEHDRAVEAEIARIRSAAA
jgi:hypothetical protein